MINRAGLAGRRTGTIPPVTRDLPWDAMVTVAERLSPLTDDTTLTVRAGRRYSVVRWRITEGLEVFDKGTVGRRSSSPTVGGPGGVLYLGPDRAANVLEVISVARDDGSEIVIHVMRMRAKCEPFLRGERDSHD